LGPPLSSCAFIPDMGNVLSEGRKRDDSKRVTPPCGGLPAAAGQGGTEPSDRAIER
jgi:hypothetical protein